MQWRRQSVWGGTEKLPTSFLKHAEDQTVLALAAVFAAIQEQGWQQRSFADWGVLAAPNFFGRIGNAQVFQRYRAEGAWGVSPHLIPHQSLHGMSGAVSQALTMHGPNFGIGAGPDAFLIAIAMLADGGLPGLWLVLTGHETEWIPAAERIVPAPPCHAVALALMPEENGHAGGRLSIGLTEPGDSPLSLWPDFELGSFAEELAAASSGKWRLSDSHWLELTSEVQP